MEYTRKQPTFEAILDLYGQVGWTNYTQKPDMLAQAFDQSLYSLYAMEGDQLIGLIRLVGDGVSSILIQDLLVAPAHQRQGIGRTLLKQALEQYQGVYQIQLTTEISDKTLGFYRSLGFKELESLHCTGMIYQPK